MSLLDNFHNELSKNRNEDEELNNIYKEYTQQLLNALKNTENTFEEQIRIFEVLSELRRKFHIMISEQKNGKCDNMDRKIGEKDSSNTNSDKNDIIKKIELSLNNEKCNNMENIKRNMVLEFPNSIDQEMANKNSLENYKLESICINKKIEVPLIKEKNEEHTKITFKNNKYIYNNKNEVHVNNKDNVSINEDIISETSINSENGGKKTILKNDQNENIESSNNWFKRIFWCFS